MAGWARYFVACSCCLSTPPFGEFSFLCQSKMERGNFGRTQPDTLARSPPPQPCHLGRWPARQPAASSERPSLLLDSFRGDNAVWLFTAPGRASWLQSQLAAAWARSPASLGPRSGCLCSGPTVARLFFFLAPLLFCAVANLGFLSSLFSFFFPPFFFSLVNTRSQGEGASWRALECPGAVAIEGQRLEQFGSDCRRRCPARGFPAGSPQARVPRSLVSWPSLRRVSLQLQRLGHCSWLLAEPWKPPRLNAAPADVTAACDQSAPRGPSVNHSASPPAGENAGRPRLEDQWRRARAVPATRSEMS
ncbi:uncharacterized protein LOC117711821 [Arvicanthis niloticus]|uniref:uncharacterized protein LOC117711821 n=1 Tax=Arvicanthis niloticus TaxID=61156 RepID=UPI00403C9EE2